MARQAKPDDTARAIQELQESPGARGTIFRDIDLKDTVETTIRHGLGRKVSVFVSPVRTTGTTNGRIEEIRTAPWYEKTKTVVLKAQGFGATVTVDVWVL